jgi:hypothetical protein
LRSSFVSEDHHPQFHRGLVYAHEMPAPTTPLGRARLGRLLVLTLTAVLLHKLVASGRNKPVIFGCLDQSGNVVGDYVVKLSGAMETRHRGPASELVASNLAEHFRILRPEPAAVQLHPDLVTWLSKQRPDLAAVLRSSGGLNFGTKLLTDVSIWPVGRSIPDGMMIAAAHVFAFDCLISNDDRRRDNPNVLVRGDDIFVIDHEAAFSFLYSVVGRVPWAIRHQRSLQNHVFFYQLRKRQLDLGMFTARLAALGDTELETIIRGVPNEWHHPDLGRVSEHLRNVRDHAAEFERQILEILA